MFRAVGPCAVVTGLAALTAILLVTSCASAPGRRPASPGSPATLTLPDAAFAHQYLFRLSHSGPGPDASGKLALYLDRPGRYLLRAADPLGRTAWTLEAGEDGFLLVDDRHQLYCRGERVLELTALDLGPLPPDSLPAVLLGYLPVVPPAQARSSRGALSFRDGRDRRWSVRVENGLPSSWTLERDDEALVWWTREGEGGILSHRRGEQFRWRRTVSEPLAAPPPRLVAPPAYRETVCHATDLQELRQDQPPPGGGGPAA